MKLSQFRKLIREEVRRSISSGKRSSKRSLYEAVKPLPLDSSITSGLVFLPYDDMDGLAELTSDEGTLPNALFIFEGPKTGIIVNKSDVRDAIQAIKDTTKRYGDDY